MDTEIKENPRLLTDEQIMAVKPTPEEYEALDAASKSYEPRAFSGCFFNEEKDKLVKHKIAAAQDKETLSALAGKGGLDRQEIYDILQG